MKQIATQTEIPVPWTRGCDTIDKEVEQSHCSKRNQNNAIIKIYVLVLLTHITCKYVKAVRRNRQGRQRCEPRLIRRSWNLFDDGERSARSSLIEF